MRQPSPCRHSVAAGAAAMRRAQPPTARQLDARTEAG